MSAPHHRREAFATFYLAAKAGIDASMLKGLDLSAAKTFIEEKGIDLSILDTLGLDLDELLAKFTGDA
jgi:hypothetical protein